MPMSLHEQRRRAKEMKATAAPVQTYVFTDPHFRPDHAGGWGGQRTFMKNGKHCIVLTARAAQFLLDQGAIEPEAPPAEPSQP